MSETLWLERALGLGFGVAVLVASLAMIAARSLIVAATCALAAGAFAAGTLMLARAGELAVAQALFVLCVAPLLLFGTMLLSARVLRNEKTAWRAALVAPVGLIYVLVVFSAGEAVVRASGATPALSAPPSSATGWIAMMLVVAGCVGLGWLGYGVRGVFGADTAPSDE